MRLPPNSIIATRKLTEYLLTFRARNDKSLWLAKAGYTVGNWEQLEQDLRQQVLTQNAELDETNQYDMVYRITAQLVGPNAGLFSSQTACNWAAIWALKRRRAEAKLV